MMWGRVISGRDRVGGNGEAMSWDLVSLSSLQDDETSLPYLLE